LTREGSPHSRAYCVDAALEATLAIGHGSTAGVSGTLLSILPAAGFDIAEDAETGIGTKLTVCTPAEISAAS
jgi:hypothetical protein